MVGGVCVCFGIISGVVADVTVDEDVNVEEESASSSVESCV